MWKSGHQQRLIEGPPSHHDSAMLPAIALRHSSLSTLEHVPSSRRSSSEYSLLTIQLMMHTRYAGSISSLVGALKVIWLAVKNCWEPRIGGWGPSEVPLPLLAGTSALTFMSQA